MEIFVFGSNLLGLHGGGAAKDALDSYGAVWGQGSGRQGSSYAIPTKHNFSSTMSVEEIRPYVNDFLAYALENPQKTFFVTAIGCGLAGHTVEDIAPMFAHAPLNCRLHDRFTSFLNKNKKKD